MQLLNWVNSMVGTYPGVEIKNLNSFSDGLAFNALLHKVAFSPSARLSRDCSPFITILKHTHTHTALPVQQRLC